MIVKSLSPEVVAKGLKLKPTEFCYHVYMPIKVKDNLSIPKNLQWVIPLIERVRDEDYDKYKYFYLTVKHMWVEGYGNREGWHIDGFATEDTNYIWSDTCPTEFCIQDFDLTEDHNISLIEMSEQALPENCIIAEKNQLIRLDTSMVHRPTYIDTPTLRTFVKISCSNERYNLKGNATNPAYMYIFPKYKFVERREERNHPTG